MSNKMMTGPVRCVWPALQEPKAAKGVEDGKAKYSITLLIPKKDKDAVKSIEELIKSSVNATAWKAPIKTRVIQTALNVDPGNKFCALKDGDKVNERRAEEDKTQYDFYAAHRVLKVGKKASFGAPGVYDAQAKPIPQIDIGAEIVSGDWVRCQISAYCYEFNGEFGVSLQLAAVQKVRKGEALGNYNPFDAVSDAQAAETMGVSDEY